ncbi:hypothetical protein CDD83_3952 [Cordyceps sp. RAO-2017]|nr:hypothetical protein CDD83_3952 [Cordyceps sp. RAO-2017]
MFPSVRTAASLALRPHKPTTALVPFRAVAAAARRDASSMTPHAGDGAPAVRKPRREVPLASEEGTKGVIQYAL